MKNGFVKVAAATPDIRVADVAYQYTEYLSMLWKKQQKNGAKILVFPELCVTGYTCSDLFDHSDTSESFQKSIA